MFLFKRYFSLYSTINLKYLVWGMHLWKERCSCIFIFQAWRLENFPTTFYLITVSNQTLKTVIFDIKFLQAVYQLRTYCEMAQCKEMIQKMEEWSTNSIVIKASVLTALLSFVVSKDSGTALNQTVSQKVSISEMSFFSRSLY